MGVVTDRKSAYIKQRDELKQQYQQAILSRGTSVPQADIDAMKPTGFSFADEIAAAVANLDGKIASEEQKRQRQRAENIRRRHNYVPFIVELLKILATQGKLVPLLEQAKKRISERPVAGSRLSRE